MSKNELFLAMRIPTAIVGFFVFLGTLLCTAFHYVPMTHAVVADCDDRLQIEDYSSPDKRNIEFAQALGYEIVERVEPDHPYSTDYVILVRGCD